MQGFSLSIEKLDAILNCCMVAPLLLGTAGSSSRSLEERGDLSLLARMMELKKTCTTQPIVKLALALVPSALSPLCRTCIVSETVAVPTHGSP